MKVLVTGADGYIGAVLTPYLGMRGYAVTGLDTGFYRSGWLFEDHKDRPGVLFRDIREVKPDDLAGFDAVVHLAELSNDPLGAHDRETTFDINHRGSMNVAHAAKEAGVGRFVYASSCSVYGFGSDDIKTEESRPDPLTAYAECKLLCEKGILELAGPRFTPTALRNATAFGASPRMRFDIVLNNLAGLAFTRREIAMTSDGTPWRPLVHILDICQAIDLTLKAPAENVRGEIFNVGDDRQNYRVREIAEIVADIFPECTTSYGPPGGDDRSYQVSFARIRQHLPDFACRWSAERGARQLLSVFQRIGMTAAVFDAPPFTRLKELKVLITSGQLDSRFFWNALDLEPDSPGETKSSAQVGS